MDTSPDYFRGSYLDDVAEIRHALEPIEVLKVFEDRFDHSIVGWPYSVTAETVRTTRAFSNSTNAMIAFALLATLGQVQRAVLLPLTRRVQLPSPLSDERRRLLRKKVLLSLGTLAAQMRKPAGKVRLESKTFGINDPFTVTWLVEVHSALGHDPDASEFVERAKQLRGLVREIFGRVGKDVGRVRVLDLPDATASPQPPTAAREAQHPFPLLRVAHLREAARQIRIKPPEDVSRMRHWFAERLRHNLADHLITDSPSDAADLVFSLEGLLASGPTPDESTTEAVFRVLRESQTRSAHWRPVRPFITTRQGYALLPLSIEVANSLLRCCDRLDSKFPERSFFSENLALFKRYAQWLRSRLVQVNVGGVSYVGWHSEHTLSENTIDLWETSQVLVFLLLYADLLKRHVARATLIAAKLTVKRFPVNTYSPGEYWAKEAIPKEPLLGFPSKRQVYRHIEGHFVRPTNPDNRRGTSGSMLLYGPPGTGKTGIAEDLAAALGRPLITVTPSDFLAEGPNEVEARAKVIFDALVAQSDCVILFDEIDRLLLDRDAPMYHKQSDAFQFMTPSMLVKLKELRSTDQTIFIIATNYYERIDPAARRAGRVDYQYLVMPPSHDHPRVQIPNSQIEPARRRPERANPRRGDVMYRCPIAGCDKIFNGSRGGWDSHVGSVRIHPNWHPEVQEAKARKRRFETEFQEFFW
jgi:hypothetical protein